MLRLQKLIGSAAKALTSLLLVIVIAVVFTRMSLDLIFGIRFMKGATNNGMRNGRATQRPLAVARVVDPASPNQIIGDAVSIQAFKDVYASVGVTGTDFVSWEQQHGMDSLGTTANGKLFVSGYPVLSKIAWMYVDSVTLTPTETMELIEECERAAPYAVSEPARQELKDLSMLARRALDQDAVVRFGPP